jgi:hypothetical protein
MGVIGGGEERISPSTRNNDEKEGGYCGGGGACLSISSILSTNTYVNENLRHLISLCSVISSRQELNSYLYKPDTIYQWLPHLLCDNKIGRPNHYNKTY